MAAYHENIPIVSFDSYCRLAQTAGDSFTVRATPPEPGEVEHGCILNAGEDGEMAAAYLEKLRRDPHSRLAPVFLTSDEVPSWTLALADGVVASAHEALKQAALIEERLASLSSDCFTSDELALLAYLCSRRRALEPASAPDAPLFYQYPIAECFFGPDAASRVGDMLARGLLEETRLIDRVRLCPHCQHTQLNYVDACPTCGSINIRRQPFLHCFACGHVGPQDKFVSAAGLVCPHCRERLRHIGADYDRPLESYVCLDCHGAFTEPSVIARCMSCGRVHDPADLAVHTVSVLDISAKGHTVARTGNLDDIYSLLDEFGYLQPAYFERQLGWMLRMVRRYREEVFSVVGIKLQNVPQLIESMGRQPTHDLLRAFARRLGEMLRTTDITTRTAADEIWILLPRTPEAGCCIIMDRVRALGEGAALADGTKLQYSTYCHSEDGRRPENEDAAFVMAQYATELHS